MSPALQTGDIVIIDEIDTTTLQTGDIIQFVSQDRTLVVHRIYDINQTDQGNIYITKGDANDNPDFDPVIPQNIRGKAIMTIPKIGWIQLGMRAIYKQLMNQIPAL